MGRLVGGIPEDAQKDVRSTLYQINNQLCISRLTRLSEYDTKRATQRRPRFQSGGLEQLCKGPAFIQDEQDQFVPDGPAIEKRKGYGASRECVRSLEGVVESDNFHSPRTLSTEPGR